MIYEIINFPKHHRKNLAPWKVYRLGTFDLFWLFSRLLYSGGCLTYLAWTNFQGRNLSIFFGGILENWSFHISDYIWPLDRNFTLTSCQFWRDIHCLKPFCSLEISGESLWPCLPCACWRITSQLINFGAIDMQYSLSIWCRYSSWFICTSR